MKAIIPVAGYGTRFLPVTKVQPKEMLAVVDKPVIQYIVEEVVNSGIKDIVLVTSQNKKVIEDYFDRNFELEYHLQKKKKSKILKQLRKISEIANFVFVRQKEMAGNGDAILCASHLVKDEPCAVVFGDDIIDSQRPCLRKMTEVFKKYGGSVIAVERISRKEIKQYGSVGVIPIEKRVYQIKKIVEKPEPASAPSTFGVIGRYIITPEVIKALEKIKPKIKGELGITDAFQYLLKNNRPVYAYEFEGRRFDCGNKLGFLQATVYYGLKHPEIGEEFKNWLSLAK